ncbi:camp-regulated phosphoprotein/endosulfine conserved region-domain-containing protein [Rhodocollybia butyracea]|uniref:mRNA stability protein n=1 Tax=Rhodocollybia butyracea TaxID=206335 RepID=A0A9P5PD03_9AGAR|nr:camp-regulated phosphoprotein/endosulfine conserved region-domain-containing protein [Rhodocollybia butyracea]
MLPAQRNKVDIGKLNAQEQLLFAKYGKLPTHKNTLMKVQKDRKYFDSGDYALSKAGVTSQESVGTTIPNPENIPHASSPPTNGSMQSLSTSPTNPTSPIASDEAVQAETETSNPATPIASDDAGQDTPASSDSATKTTEDEQAMNTSD